MTGNNRQFQPKKLNVTDDSDLPPLIYSPSRSRRDDEWEEDELLDEDDALPSNPPRPPTSSIRWNTNSTGRRATGSREVSIETTRQHVPATTRRTTDLSYPTTGPIQRYGRKMPHESTSPPWPVRHENQKQIHWLLYVGVGMIAALALWVTASTLLAWGTEKFNDIMYGNPRIYQTDYVVGHNHDSQAHPSHFIALNLHGQVIIVEFPAGDPTKSMDYIGPALIAAGDEKIPIRLSFSDVNSDNKVDMIVHIQDKEIHFCNNGTKFTACH